MKFCPHCGTDLGANGSDAKFCGSCGQPLTASAPSAAPLPGQAYPSGGSYPSSPASSYPFSGYPSSGYPSSGFQSSANPSATPYASAPATQQPFTGAPAQGTSAVPWAAGATTASSDVRGSLSAAGASFRKIPKPVVITVAALAAIGCGLAAALSMREAPTMAINTDATNLKYTALTNAPKRMWTISTENIARGAGVSEDSASSANVSVLNYGKNGSILTQVSGSGTDALVAINQLDGKVKWKVDGSADRCVDLVGGWVCTYTPVKKEDPNNPSSSPTLDTENRQLVTIDDNGHLTKKLAAKEGEDLTVDPSGTPWLTSGLPAPSGGGSASAEGTADGSSNSTSATQSKGVMVQKIDGSGTPGWRFERSLFATSDPVGASGLAAAPIFVVGDTTYVRGVVDSDHHGVALDASGKQIEDTDPIIANDRGRLITQEASDSSGSGEDKAKPVKDAGETMQDAESLWTPAITDSAAVPLFNVTSSDVQKLTDNGGKADWKKTVPGGQVVGYCGGTSIVTGEGNQVWFFGSDGKEIKSGTLEGKPQFCWGGKQLVWLDDTAGKVYTTDVTSGANVWEVQPKVSDGTDENGVTSIHRSPTANGFVALTSQGLGYWG